MSTYTYGRELHRILGIAALLSLIVTTGGISLGLSSATAPGSKVRRPWIFFPKVAVVTAGSLPVTLEATVNTITGPGAGGVSLGPLSEGPCWHSPWSSMVSPLQKKENNRQVQLASALKTIYPINFLSKTQKHRCDEAL